MIYKMKRNSVHITWGPMMSHTNNGFKERFRANSIEQARETVARRNKANIAVAVFIDKAGIHTIL